MSRETTSDQGASTKTGAQGSSGARARPHHRRHRAHRRPHKASSLSATPIKNEINVTPLVDVVLVLLIIFMVVTPMLSRGVSVDLPVTQNHAKKNDTGEQLVVTVRADGKVFVENDPVTDDNIIEYLKRALKAHPAGDVHVKGDRRLEYGKMRRVLERIHEAGAPMVALGSEEMKKEGQ
jgi:biopolymer transport protein TolR